MGKHRPQINAFRSDYSCYRGLNHLIQVILKIFELFRQRRNLRRSIVVTFKHLRVTRGFFHRFP
jgi:hypothetical protein